MERRYNMKDKIEQFIVGVELKIADDKERERLYNKDFQIAIDGEFCLVPFGAEEWYSIKEVLEKVLDDM